MRIKITAIAVLCLLASIAYAQKGLNGGFGKQGSQGKGETVTSGGSCTSSTNWINRSGVTGTDKTNYDTLLCSLDTNGVGCNAALDFLYILAAPNSTMAKLNLCSTAYSLAIVGTETFTAYRGYAGDGSTGSLTTGFTPSTNNFFAAQDSATAAVYLSAAPNNGTFTELGALISGREVQILPHGDFSQINTGAGNFTAQAAKGTFLYTRTSSSLTTFYFNGSSIGTSAATSGLPTTQPFFIGARNNNGTADTWSTDQIAAVAYGSGFNSTQQGNFRTALQTYMTAVGN